MTFSFNNIFKKRSEDERQPKDEIQENIDYLKENVYYGQKMLKIGSWTHFIVETETFFSEEIYNIFGSEDKGLKGEFDKFNTYIHPEDRPMVLEKIEALLKGKDYDIEYRIITQGGMEKLVHEKTQTIYDDNDKPVKIFGVIQEISPNSNIDNEINYSENYNSDTEEYDRLTGLKNPSYFLKEVETLKENSSVYRDDEHGLIMLEVHGIKRTKFSLGDKLGDKLILEIVARLKSILPDNTDMCRYSEDHFAIVVEGKKGKTNYDRLAEDIIKVFSKPFKVDLYELIIRTNIGICVFPKKVKDDLPLKNSAKIALINSTKQGKNKYEIYSSELNIEYYKEFTLRSDLCHAVDKEQLELYYQPIVNLETNEIMCAEVLIRWNHPQWGIVPPNEFISIAEETGLIIDIGKWVLRKVCENYKRWIKEGLTDIKVGVNFSSIQFFEKGFVYNIREIIQEYYLDPKFLIMEIKEDIFLRDKDKVTKDVKKLRAMGIQIALDDFGTGFSSFSYLNPSSINILKLDKSFISEIPLDKNANIITKATIKLAKELKIKFVAKGIEDLDQLSYLKKLKCVTGQGNMYSEAIPVKKFEELLLKKECKPKLVGNGLSEGSKDRRKFFRIDFIRLLETNLTIIEMEGKTVNIGNTKVLVKDIGPGGLCFISNIRFPIEKRILLRFATNLIEKEMIMCGRPVWVEELDNKIYKYGVEFKIEGNEREDLFKVLNQVQLKMRNNILFDEGRFIEVSHERYFE